MTCPSCGSSTHALCCPSCWRRMPESGFAGAPLGFCSQACADADGMALRTGSIARELTASDRARLAILLAHLRDEVRRAQTSGYRAEMEACAMVLERLLLVPM